MEAIWRIEVVDFPAFIVIDDKGNDFLQRVELRVMRFRIEVNTLDGKLSFERDTAADALAVAEGGKESLGDHHRYRDGRDLQPRGVREAARSLNDAAARKRGISYSVGPPFGGPSNITSTRQGFPFSSPSTSSVSALFFLYWEGIASVPSFFSAPVFSFQRNTAGVTG